MIHKISLEQAAYWSYFQIIELHRRKNGIRIDLDVVRKGIKELEIEVSKLETEILTYSDDTWNIRSLNSPKQLSKILINMGFELPKSEKGNYSTKSKWLKANKKHRFIFLILEYRTTKKLLKDFFIKPLEFQEYCCPEALVDNSRYGRLFPEINVLGAKRTGRDSSSSPNIHQVPKRNKLWGALCRSMFVSEEGKQWYSLDYSNQEGRLQCHFAAVISAPGIAKILEDFKQNPYLDLHQTIANLANITRSQAKPINLGISYGMQSGSLAKSLNLPTELVTSKRGHTYEIAGPEAQEILDQYYQCVPYIKTLIDRCKTALTDQKFIKTLDGRRLRLAKNDTRMYTAISKKIQGSASDMMHRVSYLAYKAGLNVVCCIHDEANLVGTEEDCLKLKDIMENTYKLNVPFVTEVKVGDSWGTLEKLDINKVVI